MTEQTAVLEGTATYDIDPAHSEVGFTVRHMGFSKVRGRFERYSGQIRLQPDTLSSLEVEVDIEAASISTDEEKRDEHLRTNDFLDAQNHETITFKSTGPRDANAHTFELEGDLTIRGVTKAIVLEGTYLGEGTDPWGGSRVGFEASTVINRKDFGVNWNTVLESGGFLVGENVEIELNVQAVRSDD
ncbi:MAG: YceI family protein [Rhodothermales bacterium]